MKKIVLATLVAALILGSCASTNSGGGQPVQAPPDDNWWFLAREEGGMRVRNNQVTLRKGDNYLYIYFRAGKPQGDFDKIQLNFTLDRSLDVTWQAAYDGGNVWGSEELIGNMDQGPIETDFASFTKKWFGDGKSVTKSDLRGMCLMVRDPEGKAVFTLTDVVFLGLDGAAEPAADDDSE